MDQTDLEIVVEGATGLKSVHLIQGLLAYPVVSIRDSDGNPYYDSENKKAVDLNGGSSPVWRVLFEFNIDTVEAQQKQLHLIVRLESHRLMPCFPDKYVGEVRVPIDELLRDFGGADEKKSTTRPVLNKKGKAHGSLTFTYKFRRTPNHPPPALPEPQLTSLPEPAALPEPQLASLPEPLPEPAALPEPQLASLPEPAALESQPANENSVAQIPPRCNNDSNPIVKAAVEGAASGFVRTLGSMAKELIFR